MSRKESKGLWEIKWEHDKLLRWKIMSLGTEGWEPYAVTEGKIWLRRWREVLVDKETGEICG